MREKYNNGTLDNQPKTGKNRSATMSGACTAPVRQCGDASRLDADDPDFESHEPHDTSLGVRF